MPSLADVVAASQSYTNADLTPRARRKRAGVDETVAPEATTGKAHPYVAPDGGIAEQDRLLAEAKATQKKTDPLMQMLENRGTVAGQEARSKYETPGEAMAQSLGDTAVGVMKGGLHIPGDLLAGALGLPGAIVHGYEQLPEGLQAIVDPATWRGMPDAAKQQFMELANNPEEATRLFGGMLAAGPAGDLAGSAVSATPGFAGGAISKLGRGVQAVGKSSLVQDTGLLRKGAALLHPGLGTAAAAVGPELLTGAGKAIEGFGGKVANIPNSASLGALKKLANKDVGAAVRDTFTPTATADDLAAERVRGTVDTAKDLVAKGQSRGQAAQRAGWPLAGDFELNDLGQPVNKYGTGDFGHHPGQNVEAHRPYTPGDLKAQSGGEHISSLGALDDLAGPTNRVRDQQNPVLEGLRGAAQPEGRYFAGDDLDNPQSQRYMNDQYAQNKPIADAAREASDAAETDRVMNALRNHQAAADATFDTHLTGPEVDLTDATLSPLDRLARLSRVRAKARSFGSNTPLDEGY